MRSILPHKELRRHSRRGKESEPFPRRRSLRLARWYIMQMTDMEDETKNIDSIIKRLMVPGGHIYCVCRVLEADQQMDIQLIVYGMEIRLMSVG